MHYDNYEGPQLLSIFITLLMILYILCQEQAGKNHSFIHVAKESFFPVSFFTLTRHLKGDRQYEGAHGVTAIHATKCGRKVADYSQTLHLHLAVNLFLLPVCNDNFLPFGLIICLFNPPSCHLA